MKPTVISTANSTAGNGTGSLQTGGNGVNIPINHEVRGQSSITQPLQQPQFHTQAQQYVAGEPHVTAYGSPNTAGRPMQQQHHQQEIPAHFQQEFGFEPGMGVDMFPRSRLGRMTHDPFGDFGGTTRKRTSLHDPEFNNDDFSRYFDNAAEFGFPQFNSLGRRRINPHNDDDFFNRLPSEFRQYIPESFNQRRGGSGVAGSPSTGAPSVHSQHPNQHHSQPQFYNTMPQSPSKKVCDAAIQTEDPAGRSEVDHANTENLIQRGLRNTRDMGVKSSTENENHGPRSLSEPPTEHQQNQNPQFYTQSQEISVNGPNRKTSPPQQEKQSCTQTSPQVNTCAYESQSPQFQKGYHAQQNVHLQQKQQTPPPQTPGGSYVRTIPIFVEGRSEPIINNKEIPSQTLQSNVVSSSGNSRGFTPLKKQTHRPTPLNTQQESISQQNQHSGGLPPETPHTVDTINKIQNIQRDVLDLMSCVEKFSGTRADKEYAFLDEMLTRNLLKLDNIDTNGKESIRLARKEAIKCIQASINVLEAKAEENMKTAKENIIAEEKSMPNADTAVKDVIEAQEISSANENTKEVTLTMAASGTLDSVDAETKNEPIPLPPPESQKFNEVKIEDCPEDDGLTEETGKNTSCESENKNEYTTETK